MLIELDVLELLSKFKMNKSPGCDGIHVKHVLQFKDIFAVPLQILLNICIENVVVAEAFKVALVRSVHKAGILGEFANYRPISPLPTLDKILEGYISNTLVTFLTKYDLIDKNKFAYQREKGTITLLHIFANMVNTKLDEHKHVLCMLINFSKTFDPMDHKMLLSPLEQFGARGVTLRWIGNYLDKQGRS